jgi:hypothetical protein
MSMSAGIASPTGAFRWLAAMAMVLLAWPAALRAEDPSIYAVFGWAGQMPSDRWAPITVHIQAADQPLAGHIVLEYTQDTFQHARILAPFAAAAGRTTATQVLVNLPPYCDRLDIRLVDERGRRITSASYIQGGGPRSGTLPQLLNAAAGLIVSVGRPIGGGLPEAFRAEHEGSFGGTADISTRSPDAEVIVPWVGVTAVSVLPTDLPLSHMAYDGVMMLVVPADAVTEISQTSLASIQQWVLSGGRLVVVADSAGDAWRSWLPPAAAGLVDLAPAERLPLPKKLSEAIASVEPREGREQPAPAQSVNTRMINLSEQASRKGWRVAYASGSAGPMARGPVGFGEVTILGFDPQRTSAVVSAPAAAAVWKQVLHESGAAFFTMFNRTPQLRTPGFMWVEPQQQAMNQALESLARLPVLGFTVFWIMAGALGLLAALVGPLDYFVLKRRGALQRSWLTAIVWITIASLVAAGAPRFIRTDPTHVGRLTVVDQVQDDEGQVEVAAATALTGIYAGHGGSLVLDGVDPASWWSGVSVRYPYAGQGQRGRAPLPMLQQAAGGELGSTRGNPVSQLPMAQWTFRTFIDHSLHGVLLRARIVPDEAGGEVTITGIPEGSAISTVLLQRHDDLYRVNLAPSAAGDSWTGRYDIDAVASSNLLQFQPGEYGYQQPGRNSLLASALAIPGPDQRAYAARLRVQDRQWAALYLEINRWPPHPRVNHQAQYDHTVVARILIPLETP